MKLAKSVAAVSCALLLGVALSSCSNDDDPGDGTSVAPTGGASESTTPAPTDDPSSSEPVAEPGGGPSVDGAQGAIADLELGKCSTEAGAQTVTGEVTSSADKKVDYVVTLHWTTDEASGVGDGFAVVRNVSPGQTKKFTVKAEVGKGATKCIPHVVYGKVKG